MGRGTSATSTRRGRPPATSGAGRRGRGARATPSATPGGGPSPAISSTSTTACAPDPLGPRGRPDTGSLVRDAGTRTTSRSRRRPPSLRRRALASTGGLRSRTRARPTGRGPRRRRSRSGRRDAPAYRRRAGATPGRRRRGLRVRPPRARSRPGAGRRRCRGLCCTRPAAAGAQGERRTSSARASTDWAPRSQDETRPSSPRPSPTSLRGPNRRGARKRGGGGESLRTRLGPPRGRRTASPNRPIVRPLDFKRGFRPMLGNVPARTATDRDFDPTTVVLERETNRQPKGTQ